jgi:hypothetical protein
MKKEQRNLTVQIRITPSEKQMIETLRSENKEFNISKFFREKLVSHYKERNAGIGSFQIR